MIKPQCNKPLKTTCENHERCMQMIQAVLDGSATEDEVEHFKDSMSECLPCIEGYHLEKSIKDALHAKVEKKCCPQSIVNKIKLQVGLAAVAIAFVAIQVKIYHLMLK